MIYSTTLTQTTHFQMDSPNIKHKVIAENTLAFAFLTYIPIVPGHVLISPKRVVVFSNDLTAEEWHAIMDLKSCVCKVLKCAFGASGFNFAWNEGKDAGQTVPHFHLHVVPRKEGDEGITEYEPRKFLYRPGARAATPEEELADIAAMLREEFSKQSTNLQTIM